MNFATERLLIREITMDDMELIHALNVLPEVDRYNTLGIPENPEVTRQLITEWVDAQLELPRVKIVLQINDAHKNFIGLIGFNLGKPKYSTAEIWYKIHPGFWNNGYATEAVNQLLQFGFETLKLHRITAGCATGNTASMRVFEKAGFSMEGFHKKILPVRGEWLDNYEFAILEENYFKNKHEQK